MRNALMTDRYELTMLDSFIKSGRVNDPATFEVFTRRLPAGRRFGVFAGIGRLLEMLRTFEFSGDELRWLRESGIATKDTYNYLADYTFKGTVRSYTEGDLFFPNSPVLQVSGTLGECVVLETLILSVLNHDSAIATTAARMVMSAKGRPLIEMGSRRTDEESAVHAARAAYIAGFESTSNLLAGKQYDIPTVGTAAHAFTLAYETELEAFKAQVEAHGPSTTLLVDTYDITQGIHNAVEAAGKSLGAIRIDSGDLAREATNARKLLDHLGAYGTRIIVTSDLDEYVLKDLAEAPIDGYGVGTRLVSSAPMGFVYKLVEINGRPVAKKSKDKVSIGGAKTAWKVYDDDDRLVDEIFTLGEERPNMKGHVVNVMYRLNQAYWQDSPASIRLTRENCKESLGELPLGEQKVWNGDFGPFLTCHGVDSAGNSLVG